MKRRFRGRRREAARGRSELFETGNSGIARQGMAAIITKTITG
jgi:hypothetical protein